MFEQLTARLIDDWRAAWRLWSVRLHAVVLAFATLYELSPVLPAPIAAMLPAHLQTSIVGIYALAGLVTRLIKQRSNAAG